MKGLSKVDMANIIVIQSLFGLTAFYVMQSFFVLCVYVCICYEYQVPRDLIFMSCITSMCLLYRKDQGQF